MRSSWTDPRQSYVAHRTGPIVSHYRADHGSFVYYAKGAPLCPDWGSAYAHAANFERSSVSFDIADSKLHSGANGELVGALGLPGRLAWSHGRRGAATADERAAPRAGHGRRSARRDLPRDARHHRGAPPGPALLLEPLVPHARARDQRRDGPSPGPARRGPRRARALARCARDHDRSRRLEDLRPFVGRALRGAVRRPRRQDRRTRRLLHGALPPRGGARQRRTCTRSRTARAPA